MNLQDFIDQLLFEEEGTTLDFKREQYRFRGATDEEKSELLKDVLSFANAHRRTDAYILIGVKEVKGGRSEVVGISDDLDDANLQQFINSKTNKPIDFSYKAIQYNEFKVGIIHIPVQRRPFFLTKDVGKLQKNLVYIRRSSSTDIASPDEVISSMGKEDIGSHDEIPSLDVFLVSGQHDEIVEKQINAELNNTAPKALNEEGMGIASKEELKNSKKHTYVTNIASNQHFYIMTIINQKTNRAQIRKFAFLAVIG
jgi:hypothetical protein